MWAPCATLAFWSPWRCCGLTSPSIRVGERSTLSSCCGGSSIPGAQFRTGGSRMALGGGAGGRKETGRVEAFSDGVFAIAMTLLVLNIKVPSVREPGSLGSLLRQQWPSYLAFVISFAFIGIMWINHHRLFAHIRRIDHTLLVLN